MSYNFEDGVAGEKIAQTYGQPWTTWSNAPGGSEDGVFAELNGNMTAYFTYGNDQVLDLNNLTTGTYSLSFDMYIPDGKDAYNNILHVFNGGGSEWATEVNYKTASSGTSIQAGGVTTEFECPYEAWFNVKYLIDLDNDVATFYIDGDEIVTWTFSLQAGGDGGTRQLGAMDFFPPTNNSKSKYYIDNLMVEPVIQEEVLILEPFEEYTVGNKLAVESAAAGHDWWTTWSNAPGGTEDGVVAEYEGTKCAYLSYGNDQVLLLGDEENGVYDLEFDILVPDGKNGYFNILHHFAGGNSKWALESYLHMSSSSTHSPGSCVLNVAGQTITGPTVVYDAWMHFRLHVNTDMDEAEYYYTAPGEEEQLVYSWQWSLDTQGQFYGRKMAAMDFYPPQNANNSMYYLDNFSFKKVGGESAPHVVIDDAAVEVTLEPNSMDMASVTISNQGNSIADWTGWIEFGMNQGDNQTAELALHNGNNGSQIGSSAEYLREMGVAFRPSAYAGTAMGMTINSLKYYINPNYTSSDGHYTFRVYGQGVNNQPGELLTETTVQTSASGTWIEGVFDATPALTGQVMWCTVEVLQAADEYPLSMDDGHYGEVQDGNWLSTAGNIFSHCYSADNFDGAWQITAVCSGTLVPATWVSLDKTEGSILGGQSEILYLTFNSININEGEFNADLMIYTNDADLPSVTIPVKLKVDPDDVVEADQRMVQVYPNPATTTLYIKGENLSTVAIYNVAGQLVGIEKLGAVENQINLNVGAGVYFLSIYDNAGNNTVQRVVVNK
ncbi:MAG: T9SS type A sorting domain-containing protein [Bacteroidales bacterium]|nr:T9SS type A sorting domain-containing protein [Bacteroidales bacterium]